MSESPARLVVQHGPNPGTVFILEQEQIIIGRSNSNGIVLADPEISRQHAQLIRQRGRYAIEDLGSTNGSYVNSEWVMGMTPLYHDDVVSFGETISLVYQDKATLPAPSPMSKDPILGTTITSEPVIQHVAIPSSQPPSAPAQRRLTVDDYVEQAVAKQRRRWLIGCGLGILIPICLCGATFFFLDSYQEGRLLYCGALRPFWQLILGPFGFDPVCM